MADQNNIPDWLADAPDAPEAPKEPMGAGRAALEAAKQGISMGWSDEIVAAIYAAGISAGDDYATFKDLYTQYRDDLRADAERAKEEHPILFQATELATSLATPGGVAKGLKGVGTAALAGAAEAAGRAEELEDIPAEALTGAAFAGAGKGVMENLAPSARKAAKLQRKAAKEVGIPKVAPSKATAAQKKQATEVISAVAPDLPKKAPASEVLDAVVEKRKETGEAIGRLYRGLDETGAIPPRMDDIAEIPKAIKGQFVVDADVSKVRSKFRNLVDQTYSQHGESFSGTQALKEQVGALVDKSTGPSQRYAQALQSRLNDVMKDAAEKVDPAIADQWRTLDKHYGGLGTITKGLERLAGVEGESKALERLGKLGTGAAQAATPGLKARGYKDIVAGLLGKEAKINMSTARKANKILKKLSEEKPAMRAIKGRVATKLGAQLGTEEE